MLTNTFVHIPGIGPATEKKIWSSGTLDWKAGRDISLPKLNTDKKELIRTWADQSLQALSDKQFDFFETRLNAGMHYRMFPETITHSAYLDIETTGLDSTAHITTIALYDGREIKYYVHGQNLFDFPEDIADYSVLITFNGRCFDIPIIEQYFNIQLPHAQIDLRYVLSALGYKGGLKKIEKAFGINREELDGVDGYFAVLLWQDYMKNGNLKALDTLLAYNIEDVVNLETLMVKAYNMAVQGTIFEASHQLEQTAKPDIPFKGDHDTIQKLIRSAQRPFYPL